MTVNRHKEIKEIISYAGETTPETVIKRVLRKDELCIYGAGICGVRLAQQLLQLGYSVKCFLDDAADIKQDAINIKVYRPDDLNLSGRMREDITVVVAFTMTAAEYVGIESKMQRLGWKNIINGGPLLAIHLEYAKGQTNRGLMKDEQDSILAAYDLLSDEMSRELFYCMISTHVTLDYDVSVFNPDMVQYTDVRVPFRNGYKKFIDCGAYNGDTLESLISKHDVEQYIGFEPDIANYSKLVESASELRKKIPNITVLPLGVSNRNDFLVFDAVGGAGGSINPEGKTIIQTVRIDDVLVGIDDCFIKMDVEGSEIDALHGANNLIINKNPDLAISVYHRISDLWRIPVLLNSWVNNYRFYLRNHYPYGVETVLYATI